MTASLHRRAVSLMLLSAASFTVNVLLVRALGAMHVGNIWLVTGVRFAVGLGIVLAFYRREFRPGHLLRNRLLVERGVIGSLGVYLTYLTVVKLGAGRATFIGNTYVIWGALLAAWLLREKLSRATLAGSLVTLAGIGLLTNVFSLTVHPGIYDLLAMLGALLSAYIVVIIRRLHADEHSATIFSAQCVYGLLLCAVPAVLHYEPLGAAAWAIMLATGVTAGIGQLAMTRAFRDLPVAEGSLIQMLVPLGIALGGMGFFGERFTPPETVGAVLILGGSAFTIVRRAASVAAESG